MGCLQSTTEPIEKEQGFDAEEKVGKPIDKSADTEIPTMSVGVLGAYGGANQPVKGVQQITVTRPTQQDNNQVNDRRGLAQPPSVLNNFENTRYNAVNTVNTVPEDNMQGVRGVPEDNMLDSQGNIHVNKYYNQTRNHNLSNASKLTDLSEIPSIQNYSTLGVQQDGTHKMSVTSASSDTSRMLWDDISDRGSVDTVNTETV